MLKVGDKFKCLLCSYEYKAQKTLVLEVTLEDGSTGYVCKDCLDKSIEFNKENLERF